MNERLSKAEADAAVQMLQDAAAAAERAIRRVAEDSGVSLLGPLNASSNAFADAVNIVRARQIKL